MVVVHPDLLGTYGDGGNGVVLARRAAWRGIDVELVLAHSDEVLPSGDLYCLGGGEDAPQVRSAESLRSDRVLERAHAAGAVVFGVCAGYQLLGREFPDGAGRPPARPRSARRGHPQGHGPPAVGELVATPRPDAPTLPGGIPLPTLTGFENHGGVTVGWPRGHGPGRRGDRDRQRIGRRHRGCLVGARPRHLPARPGPRPQPAARRPAARLGARRKGHAGCPRLRSTTARWRRCGPSGCDAVRVATTAVAISPSALGARRAQASGTQLPWKP